MTEAQYIQSLKNWFEHLAFALTARMGYPPPTDLENYNAIQEILSDALENAKHAQ